jgi:hypothetical protein
MWSAVFVFAFVIVGVSKIYGERLISTDKANIVCSLETLGDCSSRATNKLVKQLKHFIGECKIIAFFLNYDDILKYLGFQLLQKTCH